MSWVALLVLVGCAAESIPVWAAEAVAPGVPKFHQVNERIYRGAQPQGEGWDSLAKLGVKTIIDLRPERAFLQGGKAGGGSGRNALRQRAAQRRSCASLRIAGFQRE